MYVLSEIEEGKLVGSEGKKFGKSFNLSIISKYSDLSINQQ